MITCLGVDASTKTGLALVSQEGEVLQQEELAYPKGMKGIERATNIAESILARVQEYKPDIIVTEGYALHAKFNLATMVELGTVMRLYWHVNHLNWYEVAPTALKKFVSGKGNCKKDVMILEAYKRFGFETSNDNVADAIGLAHIGLSLRGHGIPMPKINLEALEKVQYITSFLNKA